MKHQKQGSNFQAAAQTNEEQQENGKQCGRGNGSSKLNQRLRNFRKPRTRPDGDANGNGPKCAEEQSRVHAQKREGSATQECVVVLSMKTGQFDNPAKNGKTRGQEYGCSQDSQEPLTPTAALLV